MNITSAQSVAATALIESVNKSATAAQTSTQTNAEDSYTSDIAAIAAKYDPTNISLSEIPNLAKELYDKGLGCVLNHAIHITVETRVSIAA